MKQGHETFRALSQSASCDVLTIKAGRIYRFEIRTGYLLASGSISYPKRSIRAENVIVVIHRTNEVRFVPEIAVPMAEIAS